MLAVVVWLLLLDIAEFCLWVAIGGACPIKGLIVSFVMEGSMPPMLCSDAVEAAKKVGVS
jgi:hypothetical protein